MVCVRVKRGGGERHCECIFMSVCVCVIASEAERWFSVLRNKPPVQRVIKWSVSVRARVMGRGQGQIDIKWSKLAPLVSIDLRPVSKLCPSMERKGGEGLLQLQPLLLLGGHG